MRCRSIRSGEQPRVAAWNRELQDDEGASPMSLEQAEARMRRWLQGPFDVVVFEFGSDPIGYALYRPTDPDQKEADGVYLRQFFIDPAHRRKGRGTEAMRLLLDEVVAGRRLVLEALSTNPIGQKFWQSLGMQVYSVTYELRRADASSSPVRTNE
jgi:RimJ/RimL family protein N-acetyltransferase